MTRKNLIALVAAVFLLGSILCGCIYYVPREEDTTLPETAGQETTAEQTEETTILPEEESFPNQPEDGYSKRY